MFNAKWTIYQLYHGENKLQFWWNDDGIHIVLDQQAELDINNNEFIFKNNFNKTSLLINNYFVSSSFLLYLVHILIQIWFFVFSWDILNSTFVPVRVDSSHRHRLPTWFIVCKRSHISVKGKKWMNLILIRLEWVSDCCLTTNEQLFTYYYTIFI